jgi:hypothetical protein
LHDGSQLNIALYYADNPRSAHHVLIGLHWQIQQIQEKLVRGLDDEEFDVVANIRRSLPDFGKWSGAILSSKKKWQLWISPGIVHRFVVSSEKADSGAPPRAIHRMERSRDWQHGRSMHRRFRQKSRVENLCHYRGIGMMQFPATGKALLTCHLFPGTTSIADK